MGDDEQIRQIKARQRATWSAGDWDEISTTIAGVGEVLIEAAGLEPGMDVLDVGTGSGGTLAIPAALRGAKVTGVDLTPEHFPSARRRAEAAEVEVDWVEADAEDLPLDDASFDRVFSTFGHMFAPRHAVAAAEMARVCRPEGTVAFTSWPAGGRVAEMFATISGHLPPPPPGIEPPVMWGEEGHVSELLGEVGLDPEFSRRTTTFTRDSTDDVVRFWEESFGPVVVARAALGERWPALRSDLATYFERSNEAQDGSFKITFEYLITVAPKPA